MEVIVTRCFGLRPLALFALAVLPGQAKGQLEGYLIVHQEANMGSSVEVMCPSGKLVLSGGFSSVPDALTVKQSSPLGRTGWGIALDGTPPESEPDWTGWAICVNAQQGGGTTPQPPPQPTQYPNIAGAWMSGGTRITITQNGSDLTASFGGSTYQGHFESAGTIWVDFSRTCCRGALTTNNTRIEWTNNTSWTKGGNQR